MYSAQIYPLEALSVGLGLLSSASADSAIQLSSAIIIQYPIGPAAYNLSTNSSYTIYHVIMNYKLFSGIFEK